MKRFLAALALAGVTVIGATGTAHAATDDCDQVCVDALRSQVETLTDDNKALQREVEWRDSKLFLKDTEIAALESKLAATSLSLSYAFRAAQRLQAEALRFEARFEFQRNLALTRRATIIELRIELRGC
jgi:hypothetical protein